MNVHIYGPDFNRKTECGWAAVYALSKGLDKLGVEHKVLETRYIEKPADIEVADICVVSGWWKRDIGIRAGRITRNDVIEAQAAAGKPAWCIERGFLGDREEWHGFSIDGFCSSGGDFRAEGMPPDRWAMLSERLGIELQPWRTGGEYILLCAQVPWDAQVQDGNHLAWLEATARKIREHTDRPILFRPHPKAYRRRDPYGELSHEFRSIVETGDISREPATTFEDDLENAHAVVCYNSNVATLATVAGVPVFTGAPCLADPMACRDMSLIEDTARTPAHDDARRQWAANLAYKQWHTDEFRDGLPWVHLTRPPHPCNPPPTRA